MKVEGRLYGGTGTIHGTDHVDVETDYKGKVVAVWFRCQPLKFKQTTTEQYRALSMRDMYDESEEQYALNGVVMKDA